MSVRRNTIGGMPEIPRSRRGFVYLAVGALLAAAIYFAGKDLAHHLAILEAWIERLGPWGLIAWAGLLVIATSALIPGSIFSIVAGALFGLAQGAAVVLAGNLLAASLQYALSRGLLRRRIEKMLGRKPGFAAIQNAVKQDQLRLQLLLRLTPLNPATVSYLLGAAGVRFSTFLIACIGLVPHLILEVYLGYAGKHIAQMVSLDTSAAGLHDAVLFAGLAVTIVIIALVSRMARQAVRKAVTEAGSEARGTPRSSGRD